LTKKNLTAADVQDLEPSDPDLTCPLCSKLLRDAVKTPCCSTSFCESCIKSSLADNDNVCPECESVVKNASLLVVDEDRRQRVKEYIDEVVKASRDDSVAQDGEQQSRPSTGDGEAVKSEEPREGEEKEAASTEKVLSSDGQEPVERLTSAQPESKVRCVPPSLWYDVCKRVGTDGANFGVRISHGRRLLPRPNLETHHQANRLRQFLPLLINLLHPAFPGRTTSSSTRVNSSYPSSLPQCNPTALVANSSLRTV
jgi:hypothetical protein